MTVGSTKTRAAKTYLGDLIRAEFHRAYNYVEAPLVNPNSTSAGDLNGFNPLGQPVKASGNNYVFVLATDEASTIGLVADQRLLNLLHSATSGERYLILRRGPAVIDYDAIPANDVAAGGGSAGTAFTVATIVTALAALSPPIIAVRELTPTKEQTT
jgi:hypothetical protein